LAQFEQQLSRLERGEILVHLECPSEECSESCEVCGGVGTVAQMVPISAIVILVARQWELFIEDYNKFKEEYSIEEVPVEEEVQP
jgi:hypothetical protein